MSFLYRTQPALRRALLTTRPSPRLFSTAVIYHKSATDSVKDAAKGVDRAVSDAAVAGIDKGVELKDKAASAIGVDVEKPAEGTTQKASGEAIDAAKQKAGEAKAQAKSGVQDAAEKTKQGAEQVKQEAR